MYTLWSVFCLLLISLPIFLFAALTVYVWYVHRMYSHIPTPPGAHFYSGHIAQFRSKFYFDVVYEWYEKCGPLFVMWRAISPSVFVFDPKDIKVIATTQMGKPIHWQFRNVWGIGHRLLGKSIFTIQKYEDWLPRRQVYNPAFTMSFLRSLIPQLDTLTQEELIQFLKQKADGQTVVDMKGYFSNISLHVISKVAFGSDFQHDPFVLSLLGNKDLNYLVFNALESVDKCVKNPMVVLLYPFYGRKYSSTAKKIRQIGKYYIEKRFKQLLLTNEEPTDILSYIFKVIKSDNSVGIEELVDDFVAFYAMGQESVSYLLCFALLELLLNPNIMERVVQEVDEVIGTKSCVTGFELKQLTYTTQVIEETLRHHPPVLAFPKESEADKELVLSGYSIPTKSRLALSPYVTHHIPEVFENPWMFDPSRFDNEKRRFQRHEYFPFGLGDRSCIGREFAMIEAKVILALLLKTFKFTLEEGYEFVRDTSIMLYPKNGVPCVTGFELKQLTYTTQVHSYSNTERDAHYREQPKTYILSMLRETVQHYNYDYSIIDCKSV